MSFGWEFYSSWKSFWNHWMKDTDANFPTDEEVTAAEDRRKPVESIHDEYKKYIEEQERIRDLLDTNIKKHRSLEQDILAVVKDMSSRRQDEESNE